MREENEWATWQAMRIENYLAQAGLYLLWAMKFLSLAPKEQNKIK